MEHTLYRMCLKCTNYATNLLGFMKCLLYVNYASNQCHPLCVLSVHINQSIEMNTCNHNYDTDF